jgi:signal transduction histidine kinase
VKQDPLIRLNIWSHLWPVYACIVLLAAVCFLLNVQNVRVNRQVIESDRRREADWCEYENRIAITRDLCEGQYQMIGAVAVEAMDAADAANAKADAALRAIESMQARKFARNK